MGKAARTLGIVACGLGLAIAACATGVLPTDDTESDASTSDATTNKDGAPTNDAAPTIDGACTSPTTKCTSDAGAVCVNTQSDLNHCGSCTNACTPGDAGSLAPGPNNPDAGIAYDSGIGWMLGSPECEAGACNVTCASGFSDCNGICFDTQNFHDHCGTCATACTSSQWCNAGNCCSLGTEYCGASCTDVSSDDSNCGTCGNVCPAQTPTCSAGKCTAVTADTFSQSFTQNVVATAQCTAWNSFRSSLTGTSYTSIKLSGSNDTTGHTCTGAGANTLCQALHNGTTISVTCGGFTWWVDNCSAQGFELTADNGECTCSNPGYNVRPCINTDGDWGGINTTTCAAPTQTIAVTCQ